MLRTGFVYRRQLAEVLLYVDDLQLGAPPSILGANAESVPGAQQLPCPSADDAKLLVANLGTRERPELLVVNPTKAELKLHWETAPPPGLAWTATGAKGEAKPSDGTKVPARGWLRGLALPHHSDHVEQLVARELRA